MHNRPPAEPSQIDVNYISLLQLAHNLCFQYYSIFTKDELSKILGLSRKVIDILVSKQFSMLFVIEKGDKFIQYKITEEGMLKMILFSELLKELNVKKGGYVDVAEVFKTEWKRDTVYLGLIYKRLKSLLEPEYSSQSKDVPTEQ